VYYEGPICSNVIIMHLGKDTLHANKGPHTIRRHDRMSYVQNIVTNEAGFKPRLKKTGLIAGRKGRPAEVLLPMFCVGQDACLDSVITHPL
jgi:hypothetical protein